jgi:hypothetical protein
MQRTINSPGVEIFERDRSLVIPTNVGTNVFIAGFAPQGPTDEVIKITTRDELETYYGIPTNSSERYFYHSVRELLNSPASIYTFRLPYGEGAGAGFNDTHTALVYPVVAAEPTSLTTTRNLNLSAGTYFLGAPYQIELTPTEFIQLQEGSLFDWSSTATAISSFQGSKQNALTALGGAGLIVLDKAQTTINSQFEGYYIAIADNLNNNPASDFDAITKAYTTSLTADIIGGNSYTTIPQGTLQFNLSAESNGAYNSISQIMENLTDYNIDGREDDDVLSVGVFKLRKSTNATDTFRLDYVLDQGIVGSIDTFRRQLNPLGGPSTPFFLEALDSNSRNVELLVNPFISNKFTNSSVDSSGNPLKKIRVVTDSMLATSYASISSALGTTQNVLSTLNASVSTANALYPLGSYNPVVITQKIIGNLPTKIDRALESVRNDEVYDIDVVVEAGLGTVYTMTEAAGVKYYDDTLYTASLKTKVDELRTASDLTDKANARDIRSKYRSVFSVFDNFCNPPSKSGGRGDCVFIADPIRHLLVTGRNNKVLTDKSKTFQVDVYWAMRHQFELENTSYSGAYGNWVQNFDEFTGELVWIPFSGYQAAIIARNDSAEFPWSAPAGFNRGLVNNALDIAINPNQKQRDELYKVNINPVMFSPSQGIVVFGQKTLSRKPSAFDRFNVRRLFLALERPTKKAAQFFIFEPNNDFTRTRLVNTLQPLFEQAKQNGGCADYLIICDERNNTPQVIDSNELKVDILIKPTRTAEFVLCSFTATRTDAVFSELI